MAWFSSSWEWIVLSNMCAWLLYANGYVVGKLVLCGCIPLCCLLDYWSHTRFCGVLLVVILKMAELEVFLNTMALITESPLSVSCADILVPGFRVKLPLAPIDFWRMHNIALLCLFCQKSHSTMNTGICSLHEMAIVSSCDLNLNWYFSFVGFVCIFWLDWIGYILTDYFCILRVLGGCRSRWSLNELQITRHYKCSLSWYQAEYGETEQLSLLSRKLLYLRCSLYMGWVKLQIFIFWGNIS